MDALQRLRDRRVRGVTFDATGTLIHAPRLGEIYSEVLGRHGVDVEPRRARELVRWVWRELDCAAHMDRDRFTSHPDGPRGWWRGFLERLARHLEAEVTPFAAAELFDRFARADSWKAFAEAGRVLAALRARGFRLAVVANWDPRLPGVLAGLDLARHLEAVVTSAEAGVEKPHPAIFGRALAALGLEPREAVHVGDSKRLDREGAEGAGLAGLLVDRSGGAGGLPDLSPLLELPPPPAPSGPRIAPAR